MINSKQLHGHRLTAFDIIGNDYIIKSQTDNMQLNIF